MALVPLVALPVAVFVASTQQEALYEASSDVFINRQEAATSTLVGETPVLEDPGRAMDTQARLARVPAVLDATLRSAGAAELSTNDLLARSSVFPLADVLRFTVADAKPERAARLASEYARAFVRYRGQLDTSGLARTLAALQVQIDELEAGSPLHVRLTDRAQQLEALKTLRISNISVVQTPSPGDASQIAPRPGRDVALALAGGVVVALILVFLAESLSTRPRSREEFESLLGMRLLARVGLEERVHDGGPLAGLAGGGVEAAHAVRTSLELADDTGAVRTIMVTSSRSGEGKSETALLLAVAFARTGRRVTLVDLDLRSATLSRLVGLDKAPGVSALVRGDADLSEALAILPTEGAAVGVGSAGSNGRWQTETPLEVVGSGATEGHPAEILSSEVVASLLTELGARGDVVLVDVAPLLEVSDAAALAGRVDALLLVVSAGTARGPMLAEARRALDAWPVKKLGFVLTDGDTGSPRGRVLRRALRSTPALGARPERVA